MVSVEQYYLNSYLPELLDGGYPTRGISNSRLTVDDGYIICQFTRENSYDGINNYFDTTSMEAYILVAFGEMSSGIFYKLI